MKWLLPVLCFPFGLFAQTIHFDDDKILYEGNVSIQGLSQNNAVARFEEAIAASMGKGAVTINLIHEKNRIVAEGAIPLNTPFHLLRNVHFTLHLTAKEAGYTYRIDSVYLTERRRGSSLKTRSAKELLDGMEDTGASGTANEKLLNEIDMRFQKLLALINAAMQKPKP